MAEYFEAEEVTKDYDPAIFRRILSYLRPQALLAALALAALALSTASELALPVIVQRAVDRAILPGWRSLDAGLARGLGADGAAGADASAFFELGRAEASIDGRLFFPQGRFKGMSARRMAEWESSGLMDRRVWYLLPLRSSGPERSLISSLPALGEADILTDADWAALPRDRLAALPPAAATALRHRDAAYLLAIVPFFLALILIGLGATFAQTILTSFIGQRVMKDMRMGLYDKTIRQSLSFLSRHPVGRLVTRLTNDPETVNEFFTSVVSAFLKDLSVMAGVVAVLFMLDARLALFSAATLLPVLFITLIGRVKARDAFRRQRSWTSKVNAFLSEHLSGQAVVKLFNREAASTAEFAHRSGELLKAGFAEMRFYAVFRPAVDFLSALSTGAVLWFGARLVLGATLSLGTLIAFVNLIRMFYSPVMDIAEKYTLLQSAMAGGERIFSLLDADEAIPDGGALALREARGSIEFKEARFSYKEGQEVIKGLSFSVEPGEMVAIVGYTGAGKTTIANLITRLWDLDSGSILLDGRDIREYRLKDLRSSVQPVLQEVFLFSGSIRENILLGAELDEEAMRAAARVVGADEFICALPSGYDTHLSEGATNISAGQRQLISFARVVAQNPRIVILDEATSSVDSQTERIIQRGLAGLLAGRTSIVIAHRLSTIQHADRILVLGHGKLLEEGRHRELLRKRGAYWKLYRLQYGKADDAG